MTNYLDPDAWANSIDANRRELLARVRAAADLLEELGLRADAFDPAHHPWTAANLRDVATNLETEDN